MPTDFSIYAQPKVDCHCHVLDPAQFAYAPDVGWRPAGQETGSAAYFGHVLEAYGVQHALLVGPNSGYGTDNRCLLDAIARGQGRFKGIAVVPNDAPASQLQDLKAQGIVGIAFNFALHGLDYYANIAPLLDRLAALDMFVQVQVVQAQLKALAPLLGDCGARVLVDHCGRPTVAEGVTGEGFAALLGLADKGNTAVKLSGFAKYSMQDYPFSDTPAYTRALLDAFGAAHCLWASDWPFLRAPRRLDYGALLQLFAQTVPDASMRHDILWRTPLRLFGFG
ncbi:amidohydrolase family protein [Polaromonas jejuensis]|uniref:Amidohydrolase family protein n=1 Tax=Polaromonas jejuensis TaxID=457502 RepID=A0ABW0Q6U3_9BURK|nr:amidohydrolase family protein [Polaromonas jejuensis]